MTMVPRETEELVNRRTGEITEARPANIRLSTQAIAIITENIALAEKLVNSVLEDGVDFGITPGTKGAGLWDPGASKIMAAFNCYAKHNVIYHSEADDLISWTLEAELISRDSKAVVGTGVGGCSTREVKYHYRWSKNPGEDGYTPEEINQLKKKTYTDGNASYRIDNPDPGDLSHTILVMAAKRSEIDAVKSLPGVNSALRKLFDPNLKPVHAASTEPDWKHFWSIVKGMEINEKDAHRILGVESMKDWKGTLDEALILIGKTLTELLKKKPAPPVTGDVIEGHVTEASATSAATVKKDTAAPIEGKPGEIIDGVPVPAPVPAATGTAPVVKAAGIDETWLIESLATLKWKTVVTWLTEHYHVQGKRVSEIVPLLTEAQRKDFTKEIQDRLNMTR